MNFLQVRKKVWSVEDGCYQKRCDGKRNAHWEQVSKFEASCNVPSVVTFSTTNGPATEASSNRNWCNKPRVFIRPIINDVEGPAAPLLEQGFPYPRVPSTKRDPGIVPSNPGTVPYTKPTVRSRSTPSNSAAPDAQMNFPAADEVGFRIYLNSNHDFGTHFLVSLRDPAWYPKLLKACWDCVSAHVGRTGCALTEGTELRHLITYPDYQKISENPREVAVSGKAVIPWFSHAGNCEDCYDQTDSHQFENIGKKSKRKKQKKKKKMAKKSFKEKTGEKKRKYDTLKEKKRRKYEKNGAETKEERKARKKNQKRNYKKAVERRKRDKAKYFRDSPDDIRYQRELVSENNGNSREPQKDFLERKYEGLDQKMVGSSFRNLFKRSCEKKLAKRAGRGKELFLLGEDSDEDQWKRTRNSETESEGEDETEGDREFAYRESQAQEQSRQNKMLQMEEEQRKRIATELVGGNLGRCLNRVKSCFYSMCHSPEIDANHDDRSATPCDWDRLYCRKVTAVPKTTTVTLTTSAPCATPSGTCLPASPCPLPATDCSLHHISSSPCGGPEGTFDACSACKALRECSSFANMVVAPDFYNPRKQELAASFYADFLDCITEEVPKTFAKLKDFAEISAFLESRTFGPGSPSFEAGCIERMAGSKVCEGDTKVQSDSLWGLVLIVVTDKVDYSRIGGSLTGFVKFFVPESGTKILFLVLRGLCCYLENVVRRWIALKEVSECLVDRKSAMKDTEERLREKKKEKEVAIATLRSIYSVGKGEESVPPVGELESLTNQEALSGLGVALGERFKAARDSLRECENAEKALEDRSIELRVGEVLTYKARMIATRCAAEDLKNFECFLRELCVFAQTRKDVLDPFCKAVTDACDAAMRDATKIAGKQSLDDGNRKGELQAPVGSNMNSIHGKTRQDFLKRSTFGPTFYSESGFVTRPGSCEDNYLRSHQHLWAEDLPDMNELEDAGEALEEVNERLAEMEADGAIVEVEDGCKDFYHSYEGHPWKHKPYEDDCYVVDSELLDGLGEAGTDCNQEVMEIYRELENERCARQALETKPRETTTITMTTTK